MYATARSLGWRLLSEHWPKVVAYLGVFGLLGYAITFWRLKGSRPEEYQCNLISQALRLAGLVALTFSSASVRGSALLLASVVLAWGMPRGVLRFVLRLARRARDSTGFSSQSGEYEVTWVPPTGSGKYLTQEEYEQRGIIATETGLRQLLASPQYQNWLLRNHRRLRLADDDDARAEPCSDLDDE